jgi:hypothetical protein
MGNYWEGEVGDLPVRRIPGYRKNYWESGRSDSADMYRRPPEGDLLIPDNVCALVNELNMRHRFTTVFGRVPVKFCDSIGNTSDDFMEAFEDIKWTSL